MREFSVEYAKFMIEMARDTKNASFLSFLSRKKLRIDVDCSNNLHRRPEIMSLQNEALSLFLQQVIY